MEYPDLGKQCTWPSCKALDFLPLTCAYCNLIFCKDHFNQDIHNCQVFKNDISKNIDIKSYVCSIESCTTCSPVEMLCQKCQKHFCLVHRYHNCYDIVEDIEAKKQQWRKPEEQFVESVQNVNDAINKKIKKALQNPKKQETALKIQLMRLKAKAEGSSAIPTTDRVYFLVLLPKQSSNLSKPVFVSKDWSVGKVIDSISNTCKVINKNSELTAPKLRLFKAINGEQISTNMGEKISDLIGRHEINNGETLILEYVAPDKDLNNFELTNFSEYESLS